MDTQQLPHSNFFAYKPPWYDSVRRYLYSGSEYITKVAIRILGTMGGAISGIVSSGLFGALIICLQSSIFVGSKMSLVTSMFFPTQLTMIVGMIQGYKIANKWIKKLGLEKQENDANYTPKAFARKCIELVGEIAGTLIVSAIASRLIYAVPVKFSLKSFFQRFSIMVFTDSAGYVIAKEVSHKMQHLYAQYCKSKQPKTPIESCNV